MASWTCTGPSDRRVFTRALGVNELGFYYDGHINGTADTLMHTVVEGNAACFSPESITKAWSALKNRFPLVVAAVKPHNSHIEFVVAEDRLKTTFPEELSFSSVSSFEEAQALAITTIHGQRTLSDDLLARIVVLSRTDNPSLHHLLIVAAHLITDGIGNSSLLKAFLELLSSPQNNVAAPNLESRLSLAVSAESLIPTMKMSVARQRWRRAAGHIISKLQDAKRTGGQTLPRSFGPIATRFPARSGCLRFYFTPAESSGFMRNLRKHGITVGNALPVLAQVALARVLCRRYVRGEISAEEWEFRKKQPYHNAGPINLRPFLDKAWYEAGGQDNVSVNVAYFYLTLPFTSLGPANLAPGDQLPELSQLLSHKRFLLRCHRMKKLAARYFKHPLFYEIGAARLSAKPVMLKDVAERWEADPAAYVQQSEIEKHNVGAIEQANLGTVMTHGWSTFGNMDKLMPRKYPSGVSGSPTLQLQKYESDLHCRTGELYLGAGTFFERLYLILFWDRNVFSDETVEEWLSEIRQAMHFFLGETQALGSKL
ncbi:hypothetical protein C8R43DRAFT_1139082 [Mycena crocata]|nr:hypothetical protein C8R43DRAFT_1139082 [Mycena crocata]